jgi:hypothetical protein
MENRAQRAQHQNRSPSWERLPNSEYLKYIFGGVEWTEVDFDEMCISDQCPISVQHDRTVLRVSHHGHPSGRVLVCEPHI